MIDAVEIAAKKAGGLVALARRLGISHQSFYKWERVPAERVAAISAIAGIPRHELRPDIYEAPKRRAPKQEAAA